MAMTLKKPARRWLEMPHGVRVEVEPLTTARATAARNEALKRAGALRSEVEAAEKAGQPMDALGFNAASSAALAGLTMEYEIEALARFGITRWEGINGEDGHPLPVTPAACEAFAQHDELGIAFWAAYTRPAREVAAEGEGSGTSAASAGQAVPTDTAADATADQPAETESPKDTAAPAQPS